MEVRGAEVAGTNVLKLNMVAVCGKEPFGKEGESEDNTYSRWTPTATLVLFITNPALTDKFKVGQKFYVDFTESA